MRRLASLVVALVVGASSVGAQSPAPRAVSDSEQVRLAVLDYVEGFYAGDSTRLARSVSSSVYKFGYWRRDSTSAFEGSQMTWPQFFSYAANIRSGRSRTPPNARKDIVLFDVQDQTASAKLTAWWGIDYLLLAKQDGRWMITHVLWQSPPRAAR